MYDTFQKANNKGADQSAPLLFAHPEDRFSPVEAHYAKDYHSPPFCNFIALSVMILV